MKDLILFLKSLFVDIGAELNEMHLDAQRQGLSSLDSNKCLEIARQMPRHRQIEVYEELLERLIKLQNRRRSIWDEDVIDRWHSW
jgi:hypothetical protein